MITVSMTQFCCQGRKIVIEYINKWVWSHFNKTIFIESKCICTTVHCLLMFDVCGPKVPTNEIKAWMNSSSENPLPLWDEKNGTIQITKITNKRGDITRDLIEMKRIISIYYEQLYSNILKLISRKTKITKIDSGRKRKSE